MTTETISVHCATAADKAEWDDFVASAVGAETYHQFAWKGLLETVFEHDCHYLLARDGQGILCGILPLAHLKSRVFGNFLVSIPYFNYCGVLANSGAAVSALTDAAAGLARELGAGHVELRHRSHVELDLPQRDDKVSMQMPK